MSVYRCPPVAAPPPRVSLWTRVKRWALDCRAHPRELQPDYPECEPCPTCGAKAYEPCDAGVRHESRAP